MTAYELWLWLQTLLALGALGLVGGWALQPFRAANRPYLWLAAPLAGLAVLAASLTLLHLVCGLTVSVSLAVAVVFHAALTVALSLAGRRVADAPRPWLPLLTALPLLAGVTLYSNWGANRTAARLGEPTVCLKDGTDAVGYAQVADWVLRHPGRRPAMSPDEPAQAFTHRLWEIDTRRGAFLLLASAAHVRGTTALFSYDWLTGVVLAAGVLALGGLFASRPAELLLLAAAGVLSMWYPTSRTGYLGKLLAHPGCVLLAFTFLAAWREFRPARLVATAVLGAGVGLCLHPMVAQAVLGMLFSGVLAASAVRAILDRKTAPVDWPLLGQVALTVVGVGLGIASERPWLGPLVLLVVLAAAGWRWRSGWGHLGRGLVAYAVTVGPLLVCIALCFEPLARRSLSLEWSWLAALALDLDSHATPLLAPGTRLGLLTAAGLLYALFLFLAGRAGDVEAQGTLLCLAVVPLAWALGKTDLYEFHGILFPLSVTGVVLVVQRLTLREWNWPVRVVPLALAVALVALRTPQFLTGVQRYARVSPRSANVFPQSDLDALARAVGPGPVTVRVPELYAGLVLLAECGARGIKMRHEEPGWSPVLSWSGWTVPSGGDRAELTVWGGKAWVHPDGLLHADRHYQLVADRDRVALTPIRAPHGLIWEQQLGLHFWQGQAPSTFELWNGTGEEVPAVLVADTQPGPSCGDLRQRTATFQVGGQSGTLALSDANRWQLRVPLTVPPGEHTLTLAAADAATVEVHPQDPRDLVLLVKNVRLELAPTSAAAHKSSFARPRTRRP